jgi:hypothetical protein
MADTIPGQHADTPLAPPGGMLRLTVRLTAPQRRKFAAMCGELGTSQQDMVAGLIAAALHEYYVRSKLAEVE